MVSDRGWAAGIGGRGGVRVKVGFKVGGKWCGGGGGEEGGGDG